MAMASRTVARIAGERCSVFSMILLSRFSMAHANSLMSVAPTMRPEPFNVWKAAAHAGERVGLERILFPGREQLADAGHLFAGFLYI